MDFTLSHQKATFFGFVIRYGFFLCMKREYCFFVGVSLIVLLLASTLSPFYGMPMACDPHIYSSVGRGMMEGLIPYRDLFDQKGPLVFLLYGLAQWGWHSFTPVLLVEVACLFISLIYAYRLALFRVGKRKAFLVALTLPCLLCKFSYFENGGNPSEFLLPLQFMGMYWMAGSYLLPQRFSSWKTGFVLGVGVGAAFMSKFNICCFWVFPILVTTFFCWKRKKFLSLLAGSLVGAACVIIPFLTYFIYHHSLVFLKEGYFLFSVYYGLHAESLSVVLTQYAVLFKSILAGDINSIWIAFGIVMVLFSRISGKIKLLYTFSFLFCLVCLFGSARMQCGHYLITLVPYAYVGLLILSEMICPGRLVPRERFPLLEKCMAVGLVVYALCNSVNVHELSGSYRKMASMKKDLQELVPPDKTFALIGINDQGMYWLLDRIPDIRLFTICSSTPEIMENLTFQQYREVEDKKIEYLAVKESLLDDRRKSGRMFAELLRSSYARKGIVKKGNVNYELFVRKP
ncbi:glycosyltransferase family 39 protein [Akkermansia sp.]|uniref:ArnT family glycosyltransferase n=1 Tax=Akkermansia sp. TaxID=1872421 RepID=UPI0025BD6211|nr:glycosyltransferase family 39 protein [Akkermansia sp.]MCC8149610.1 glycosyltransferase family 39 protein [Akkermansia sp.]